MSLLDWWNAAQSQNGPSMLPPRNKSIHRKQEWWNPTEGQNGPTVYVEHVHNVGLMG